MELNHQSKKDSTAHRRMFLMLAILVLFCPSVFGQTPFVRAGQFFMMLESPNELVEVSINSSVQFAIINDNIGTNLDAIGFRKTDNLLYGIHPANHTLHRIDATGTVENLATLPLDPSLYYMAGDVSPDGKYLVSIGSTVTGIDVQLAITNLENGVFTTEFTSLNGSTRLVDIAFDPYTGVLFGYDAANRKIVTINASSGAISSFGQISNENEFYGVMFDAFGDLYAFGTAVFGIVDGLFSVDKATGEETRLSTGPLFAVSDMASCPYSVELNYATDLETTLPCSELTYTYTIANGGGEVLTGVEFYHKLPPGFELTSIVQNSVGGTWDASAAPGAIRIENMTLSPGIKSIVATVEVADIAGGEYPSQANLKNLPTGYGLESRSDNPSTEDFEDSTEVEVNRIEEDSLFFTWFLCHGETLLLEADGLGNNIQWNTGATGPELEVSQGGLYTLEAVSGCQTISVSYDVTSASCPYTIEMLHAFDPDTLFACNEMIFRFIIDNDSGEKRENVSFSDTLPPGFSFLEISRNPFGGLIKEGLGTNQVCLEGMNLKVGSDTLDLRVQVGDIPPGDYRNRATLSNLPLVMGPIRLSDDPATLLFDSSSLHISGTLSDSLIFDEIICQHSELTLDASQLGVSFFWENGSIQPQLTVNQPGTYLLTLFDGCEPAQVTYQVSEGDPIQIATMGPVQIHQGEQVELAPVVVNHGDTLTVEWTDPLGNSLSCLACPVTVAAPLEPVIYGFKASNMVCSDSIGIEFKVDASRRIYAPTAFSPNDDGINDYFYLQSPDLGIIRSLQVTDRWGSQVFYSENSLLNMVVN
ncbi:MAG: gliding motility-associated C-terminal domain-containing protein, partial [Bacteroidetes bacterium]|nr:gliding motility-associated C-terminal domain-containing protein [Bacteroidota bacterium]